MQPDKPARRSPLPPEQRYRMDALRHLARQGAKGPARALDALWDIILREAEGIGVAEAGSRPGRFRVQDYAMAADQAAELRAAMTERRRLPPRVVAGIHMLWASQSPCDYDAD